MKTGTRVKKHFSSFQRKPDTFWMADGQKKNKQEEEEEEQNLIISWLELCQDSGGNWNVLLTHAVFTHCFNQKAKSWRNLLFVYSFVSIGQCHSTKSGENRLYKQRTNSHLFFGHFFNVKYTFFPPPQCSLHKSVVISVGFCSFFLQIFSTYSELNRKKLQCCRVLGKFISFPLRVNVWKIRSVQYTK